MDIEWMFVGTDFPTLSLNHQIEPKLRLKSQTFYNVFIVISFKIPNVEILKL